MQFTANELIDLSTRVREHITHGPYREAIMDTSSGNELVIERAEAMYPGYLGGQEIRVFYILYQPVANSDQPVGHVIGVQHFGVDKVTEAVSCFTTRLESGFPEQPKGGSQTIDELFEKVPPGTMKVFSLSEYEHSVQSSFENLLNASTYCGRIISVIKELGGQLVDSAPHHTFSVCYQMPNRIIIKFSFNQPYWLIGVILDEAAYTAVQFTDDLEADLIFSADILKAIDQKSELLLSAAVAASTTKRDELQLALANEQSKIEAMLVHISFADQLEA